MLQHYEETDLVDSSDDDNVLITVKNKHINNSSKSYETYPRASLA